MRVVVLNVVLALGTLSLSASALADDPNDQTMRSEATRARDAQIIRDLNRQELAYVQDRDSRYAEGWQAYRGRDADSGDYARRRSDYEDANRSYADQMSDYRRRMAQWRRAVSACEAGDSSACDN